MYRYMAAFVLIVFIQLHAATITQLEQTCQKKSAKACYALGSLYDQKNQLKKAASLYQKSCSYNHARGCYKLAELYLIGSGVKQSDDTFVKYMKRSCKLGYKKSCTFIQKATPVQVPISSPPHTKRSNSLIIQEKNIGQIQVRVKLINKQKRIIQIDASMRNDYRQASGWLSFSFPEIGDDQVTTTYTQSFDHTRAYPKGYSIYHIKHKKAIPSHYLLVESDAKKWAKGVVKKTRFTLKVPDNIEILTLYVRGTLKYKTQLRSMPLRGSIGQQGFHNATLKLTIGSGKKKQLGMQMQLSNTHNDIPSSTIKTETVFTRKDKLILLDKLLDLSYYHRERKAFEKQLKETLFGGATYLTYIKSYRCEPKKGTRKSTCLLRLGGKMSQNNREVSWEFQASFTARKDNTGLKITEMHSLDLLE